MCMFMYDFLNIEKNMKYIQGCKILVGRVIKVEESKTRKDTVL